VASKECRICNDKKPISEFHRATGMRDGHRSECKSCSREKNRRNYWKDRDAAIARVRKWRIENPEKYAALQRRTKERNRERVRINNRRGHLERKYGLSIEDFHFLRIVQDNQCALCGRTDEQGLHVDHDHRTGRVRGLLCGKCNKAIGLLDEDPAVFAAAVTYLRRTQLCLAAGDREKRAPRPRRKVSP
jgi:uncharacterized protein (DUF2461 family)